MATTTGRFNYLTVSEGVFELWFKPMNGDVSLRVAKDLTREQAVDMMSELNEVINEFRKEFLK
jgi:hypothetical protein